MGIKRDDIDNRKIDFSNIASGGRLPPVHPGEILRDEFLTLLPGAAAKALAAQAQLFEEFVDDERTAIERFGLGEPIGGR